MKKDLSKVTVKRVTEEEAKQGTEMWLHAQGLCDYIVPAFGVDSNSPSGEDLIVATRDGAVYVTKEQVKSFFNLEDKHDITKDFCGWDLDGDLYEQDNDYVTSCRNSFMLNDGSLKANGFKFCPFCGKSIGS